tara:strand:+ start:891 stop:1898 length:1008 start_codon:yes stop_codon:yes gene_type:complete
MAAPNLKDNVNQWVNIEVSLNNETAQGEIFINGASQGAPFVIDAEITKDENSKIFIGSDKDGNNGFQGKMEAVGIQNKAVTEKVAKKKFERARDGDNNKLFMMELDQDRLIDASRFVDLGKGRMDGTFNSGDSEFVNDHANQRGGLKFNSTGSITVPDPSVRIGKDALSQGCTFTSWVKYPSSADSGVFQPLLSKLNCFSFGINNGHAALYLNDEGQFAPGTNVEAMDSYTVDDKKLVSVDFETNDTRLKYIEGTSAAPVATAIQQRGVRRSKAAKLGSDKKLTYSKNVLVGKDLSQFSVAMWVRPGSLTGTLFEREDIGLKLQVNGAGRLVLTY